MEFIYWITYAINLQFYPVDIPTCNAISDIIQILQYNLVFKLIVGSI